MSKTTSNIRIKVALDQPNFLDSLVINHGSPKLLGSLFMHAAAEAAQRGAHLAFGHAQDLVEANKANRHNWLPLAPTLSAKYNTLTSENFFCILARDRRGDVIAAHAARLFDWKTTNFVIEAESLRLFYREPTAQALANESCRVDAHDARAISGAVAYSGAAWIRPDYRGRQLSAIIPRVAKAYALTRWRPSYIASIMTEAVHKTGFAPRFGYDNVAWSMRWRNSIVAEDLRFAVVWMDEDQLIADLQRYLENVAPQIDTGVRDRYA